MKSRINIIEEFHETTLNQFQKELFANYKVCGWSSKESQEARFSALLRLLRYNGGSIVDFGCGTGELYNFLLQNFGKVQYIGLDFNEKMLRIARQTHDGHFLQCGFDDISFIKSDYVVASGLFQFQETSDNKYYVRIIDSLFSKAKIGLGVNFLSASRLESEKNKFELYLNPSQVLQLAESISPLWAIDHSYHLGFGDVTMAVFQVGNDFDWKRPSH